MKTELPSNHGLSQRTVDELVFRENDAISLTDVQYESLINGIGRGESALVVAPTSTGKTQIALWAIANSLEQSRNTVYLVTHRALAKQKFDDFKSIMVEPFLGNDRSSLVIATGDYVIDADGNYPSDPLNSPLLIATYEKYLALLSASGMPVKMDSTTVICDEIQLIGDEHRGQHVEILLTLLLKAGWKQFVGLSAVLDINDATVLANWLNVNLIIQHSREKDLTYECWTNKGIFTAKTSQPDNIIGPMQLPQNIKLDTLSILNHLINLKNPPKPIIVFCMKKDDTYDLANKFVHNYLSLPKGQTSLVFDELPETNANVFLADIIDHGIGVHNADLMDEERGIVEKRLSTNRINIIFSTSTLAAGVNFPLGAALFSSWERWSSEKRSYIPIESSEFHNMAGRTGRMGFNHEAGRVIYIAESDQKSRLANKYLQLSSLPSITPRISKKHFLQLSLQLISSGICETRDHLIDLVCGTYSGQSEQDKNTRAFEQWPASLNESIESLIQNNLVIETFAGKLTSTPVGNAIGYSGLRPDTGMFLLKYISEKSEKITDCLPTSTSLGDIEKLSFLIFSACFSSPEFRPQGGIQPTRFLPWQLKKESIFNPDIYKEDLVEPNWYADYIPTNAAKLTIDWINGSSIKDIESMLGGLGAGSVREMFRNLVWIMEGLSSILTAASDSRVPIACRPKYVQLDDNKLATLRKIPRFIKRLSHRVAEGLPDNVLWMKSLNNLNVDFNITRHEILSLLMHGISTPEQLMLGTHEADKIRMTAFHKVKPTPHRKANWLRDTCKEWKHWQRQKAAEKHIQRAQKLGIAPLFKKYYESLGNEFESAFEDLLDKLSINYSKIDDHSKTGAPDYCLNISGCPPIVVELKSKQGDGLVDYNKSVEVLAASEIHGFKGSYCVTVCHPGVDPSVPPVIVSSGRLCVVESHDLGEALLRLAHGTLTQGKLWEWLTTPGQALVEDLGFKEY